MHPGYDDDAMNRFLDRVQEAGGITTRIDADQASRGTLATLAEAVSSGQMHDLGEGLPAPLQPQIDESRGHARSLGKQEFLDRVGGLVHTVDMDTVESWVRGVLRAVGDWAPAGEVQRTRDQLPPDLAALFPSEGG
jgi:uncharacterized protein (DUF2267 family)